MIRLPMTSISLSDSDVSFHLQQIDIYHGLLKQGFKTADIKRYFEEDQAANNQHRPNSEDLGENSLSCVQLVTRTWDHSRQGTPSTPFHSKSIQQVDPSLDEQAHHDLAKRESKPPEDLQLAQGASPPDIPPSQQFHRHAPRQSSLLRFSKAASPDKFACLDDIDRANDFPLPNQHSYRPRTETYPYEQSEASETDLHHSLTGLNLSSSVTEILEQAEIPRLVRLRPDAATFVPKQIPKGHGEAETTSQVGFEATTESRRHKHGQSAQVDPQPSSSPTSGSSFPSHNDQSSLDTIFRSSSPTITAPTPPVSSQLSLHSSPPIAQTPATPSPERQNPATFSNVPRQSRQLQYDGESFSVYNDSLPAITQPQTPADLTRHRLITHHNASYTAPPGMIRPNSTSMSHHDQTSTSGNDGAPSPTVRAIGMRERRTRELTRGVRVEGQRLERLRLYDRESIVRGFDDNEDGRLGITLARPADRWRDELEGDRVGDENFDPEIEGDMTHTPTIAIRVVSGNAQRRLL